jgi:hypothetical protein
VEPSEGSHPGPIASASQAAGLRPVVLFTVLAMGSGLAWPIALHMALTLPPSGQQRRARSAMSSPGGGSPPGNEPDTGAVTAALASLRREHRQVIVCTFYEHLSADDAAARLGIPVRDVKRRACSALDEIRRILEERGVQVPCQPVTLPRAWSSIQVSCPPDAVDLSARPAHARTRRRDLRRSWTVPSATISSSRSSQPGSCRPPPASPSPPPLETAAASAPRMLRPWAPGRWGSATRRTP